jgi:hypothetical protein
MKGNRLVAAAIVSAVLLAGLAALLILSGTQKLSDAFSENTATAASSGTPAASDPIKNEPEPETEPTPANTPAPPDTSASENNYREGCKLLDLGLFNQAMAYLSRVIPEDTANYAAAQEKLAVCVESIKADYLERARLSFEKAHYRESASIASQGLSKAPGDPDLTNLLDESKEALANPVLYEGPIYHIFFHSLIVYPELCFTGDSMSDGYNKWMTTVSEFKAMLDELYDRGYVLIDLVSLFSRDETGKIKRNDIYLPAGTKPLVLSVDNVSYEEYRSDDGFAKRLVLDRGGNVATLVRTPSGDEIITRDGDVMPILDDFVRDHPDFSLDGAKGTIALNGYDGILGYRTNRTNKDWESEAEGAQKVVERLLETGWRFACHSYSHGRKFSDMSITLDEVISDTEKWLAEVAGMTGSTPVYITPFGIEFTPSDPRQQYLVNAGFYIFCGVSNRAYYGIFKNYAFMERINMDGYKMNFGRKALEPLIDVDKVYDSRRPPMSK